jgi:dolichol-phosphate mannosyltransferase
MTAGGPSLTMVVPTYNERERIAELVAAVFSACHAAGLDLELVIVDDNSPDGTGAAADELATKYRMKVVHREGKLGLGTAVVAGFGVASSDVVGVMDADFSHPPSLVPKMWAVFRATGADALVASRYVPGGGTQNWPFVRRVMSRLGSFLARGLSPIQDATSGFFLIRRSIATSTRIKAGGFKIALELIARGRPERLVEVPFVFDERRRGESKMSRKEAIGYFIQLKDLYLLSWSRRRVAWKYQHVSNTELEQMAAVARRDQG